MKSTPKPESTLSPWERVDWQALARLRARFLDESGAGGDYWTCDTDLDSYDLTFGQRIAWKWLHVLGELGALGWEPPSGEVLDWGCGSGVAGRVFCKNYATVGIPRLQLWDRSSLAARFAEARARERLEGVRVGLGVPSEGRFTVLFSHVLTELDADRMKEAIELARRAEAVVCVEPGTYGASRRLIHFREALRDEFQVIAPCTHQAPCGMLEPENTEHWCHHFAWPPSEVFTDPDWARFAAFMGIDLRGLPVSYLVLDRRPAQVRLAGAARWIGRARICKPHAQVLGCEAEGLRELRLTKRRFPALYKHLKKENLPPWAHWTAERDEAIQVTPVVGLGEESED